MASRECNQPCCSLWQSSKNAILSRCVSEERREDHVLARRTKKWETACSMKRSQESLTSFKTVLQLYLIFLSNSRPSATYYLHGYEPELGFSHLYYLFVFHRSHMEDEVLMLWVTSRFFSPKDGSKFASLGENIYQVFRLKTEPHVGNLKQWILKCHCISKMVYVHNCFTKRQGLFWYHTKSNNCLISASS